MRQKRFSTQLKQFLGSIDANERLTPAEIIARFKSAGNGNGNGVPTNHANIIETALRGNPRFIKKVVKAVKRADGGKVVLYTRKNEPMVMTLNRWNILHQTIKLASKGLRKYYDAKKTTTKTG